MLHLRKSLSFLGLVSILFIGTQAICVKQSQAVLLVTVIAGDQQLIDRASLPAVVLCIFLFPVCLLDEKAGPSSVSPQDLADNGYTPQQVATITGDQARLTEILREKNQRVVFQANDTRDTVRLALSSLLPTVSETYVDFTVDMNLIK